MSDPPVSSATVKRRHFEVSYRCHFSQFMKKTWFHFDEIWLLGKSKGFTVFKQNTLWDSAPLHFTKGNVLPCTSGIRKGTPRGFYLFLVTFHLGICHSNMLVCIVMDIQNRIKCIWVFKCPIVEFNDIQIFMCICGLCGLS